MSGPQKTAIVTGASQGIGAGIVKGFVAGQASGLSADKTSLFFHCSLLGMVLTHSFRVKSKCG